MKTILLLLVLFSSKLSGAIFSLHFTFDSDKLGQELSVQFQTEHFTSPIRQFNTRSLDSINFTVTRTGDVILFEITDPRVEIVEVPIALSLLGNIGIQTSLNGKNFSPDIYLNGNTSFFHSVSEGEILMQNVLFANQVLSGELQNFSMEHGQFEIKIFAVPESTSVCFAVSFLLFFLYRYKTQKPAP